MGKKKHHFYLKCFPSLILFLLFFVFPNNIWVMAEHMAEHMATPWTKETGNPLHKTELRKTKKSEDHMEWLGGGGVTKPNGVTKTGRHNLSRPTSLLGSGLPSESNELPPRQQRLGTLTMRRWGGHRILPTRPRRGLTKRKGKAGRSRTG